MHVGSEDVNYHRACGLYVTYPQTKFDSYTHIMRRPTERPKVILAKCTFYRKFNMAVTKQKWQCLSLGIT